MKDSLIKVMYLLESQHLLGCLKDLMVVIEAYLCLPVINFIGIRVMKLLQGLINLGMIMILILQARK